MGKPLKMILGILCLVVIGRLAFVWIQRGLNTVEEAADDSSAAVENYLQQTDKIREDLTASNDRRAIGQAIKMFVINNGRAPKSIEELVQSGNLSAGSTKDPFGQAYRFTVGKQNIVVISAGRDRVIDTEDDIRSPFSLQ